MARPNTDVEEYKFENYSLPKRNRLSEQELWALDKELEKFKVTNDINFPTKATVSYVSEKEWMKSRGGLTKDGGVIMTSYTPSVWSANGKLIKPKDCDPIKYEQLREDFAQWQRWKSKGDTKRLEQYAHMSQQLGEEKIIDKEDLF